MRRLIAGVAAALLCLVPAPLVVRGIQAGPSTPPGPGIDALVGTFMQEEHVAGLSVAVMKGGQVRHARGYGLADVERAVPATEHTVYRIASLSKQFTAVSILMLVEQGKVDVNAGIRTYFPEWPATGPEPTVMELLNHTSGFDFQEEWARMAPAAATDASVQHDLRPATLTTLFASGRFEFTPGTRFRYNNNAFALLGLLIERVSGVSYGAFVRSHIFEPLGMTESYYMETASIIANRASGYTFRGTKLVNAPPANPNILFSAGGLGSTVLDLLKWRRALLDHRLINDAHSRLMTTPGRLADGTPIPYGLGLFLLTMDGESKVDHYGNTTGFRSEIAYYPSQDLIVTVMADTNPARTDVLESRISRMLMGRSELQVTEVALDQAALRPYAGTYVVTDAPISHRSVTTEITLQPDGLHAGPFRLRPVGQDVFVPVGDPYHRYAFTVRDGRAVALRDEREGRVIADARRKRDQESP